MTKLKQVRGAVRNELFPTADMVVSMSKEFGVPFTTEDFEGKVLSETVLQGCPNTLSLVPFAGMTLDKCIILRIGMLTGCPLCRESHPPVQVKELYSQ